MDVQVSSSGTLHARVSVEETAQMSPFLKLVQFLEWKLYCNLLVSLFTQKRDFNYVGCYSGIWGVGFVKWNEQLHMLFAAQT